MARRKKKSPPRSKAAASSGFHTPFAGLKKRLAIEEPPDDPAPAETSRPPEHDPAPEDDQTLFARAMADVSPLDGRRRTQAPPRPSAAGPRIRLDPQLQEDLEVLARLADLVNGTAPLDIRFTDEYVEGFAPGLNPELVERLRQGVFPVQDYIDLHGLSVDEARGEVEGFLGRSRTLGYRSVLIVHGRGLGSQGQVPVLKKAVVGWLSKKSFRSQVLGFCTARPMDGGAGALYVLLTRWRG